MSALQMRSPAPRGNAENRADRKSLTRIPHSTKMAALASPGRAFP